MKHGLSAEDRAALLRQHLNDGVPLARISRQAGIPLRTLQRWTAEFRAGGIAAVTERLEGDTTVRADYLVRLNRLDRSLKAVAAASS